MQNSANSSVLLTQRDLEIILFVYHFGNAVIIDQIRQMFWPNSKGLTSPCYGRVSYLINHGYLIAKRQPSHYPYGSGKNLLSIGAKAVPVLVEMLGIDKRELHHLKHPVSSWTIKHHLAINDFRINLTLACQASNLVSLDDWETERELRQHPIRVDDPKPTNDSGKQIILVADGLFRLLLDSGHTQDYYLEMDLATLHKKGAKAKVRGYLIHCWKQGIPVLLVCPNQQRVNTLTVWILEEAKLLAKRASCFFLTTTEQISQDSILHQAIWTNVGHHSPVALVPEHHRIIQQAPLLINTSTPLLGAMPS